MSASFFTVFFVCFLLCLLQGLAALPWLLALDRRTLLAQARQPLAWVYALGGLAAAALGLAWFLNANADPTVLPRWGRIYGSALQLQLTADFFVLVFVVMLTAWPKGGAVALAAFRESLRQPMFWLLYSVALFLMYIVPFLPYFTMGEDIKMVKELGYDVVMLFALIFAVIAASSSVSEEIEGRTAVTLMSKPVSRRQFLLGKFLGIFLGSLVMITLLGWFLVWMFLLKQWWDPSIEEQIQRQEQMADPTWILRTLANYVPAGEPEYFVRGLLLWVDDAGNVLPGLVILSCQVMVLLSIAVALATRLSMVVTIPITMIFYFLGHLAPVLISVSRGKLRLVEFMAQVFDTVLPGLEHFQLSGTIVRDAPLPAGEFALYTLNVSLYAVMYTAIALLLGLILFEDRDLA